MKKIAEITVIRGIDNDPDLSYLGKYTNKWEKGAISIVKRNDEIEFFIPANPEYGQQDLKRMEKYNNRKWCMMYVKAKTKILTSRDVIIWLTHTVSSGGLYGIESDATDKDFREIAMDQLSELHFVLEELGFNKQEIDAIEVKYENFE